MQACAVQCSEILLQQLKHRAYFSPELEQQAHLLLEFVSLGAKRFHFRQQSGIVIRHWLCASRCIRSFQLLSCCPICGRRSRVVWVLASGRGSDLIPAEAAELQLPLR